MSTPILDLRGLVGQAFKPAERLSMRQIDAALATIEAERTEAMHQFTELLINGPTRHTEPTE